MDKSSGLTLLLILFIALKLTGVIHWSWLWVLAPFWIPLLLAVLCILAYFVAMFFERH